MTSKTASYSGGISFTGALTILFVALKLCHVISWSWWWVLSPIWINVSFVLALLLLLAIVSIASK